ncbi:MAG: glycosyltransferase family 39 protein [bacterium]
MNNPNLQDDTLKSTRKANITAWILASIILMLMLVQVSGAILKMSPIFDEQNHVTRGIAILRTGDYRLSLHHPPLANVLAALPVAWRSETNFTTEMPSWQDLSIWNAARTTIWERSKDGALLIQLARWPVLLFTIVLGIVIFLWAKALFGPYGGVLALAFYALDPNMLAHSGLATTDMAAACTIPLAVYWMRGYFLAPTRWRLLLAGVGIGLALVAKFSALILLPIGVLFFVIFALWAPRFTAALPVSWSSLALPKRLGKMLGVGVAMLLVSAVVVWGVYGFKVERLGSKPGQPAPAKLSMKNQLPVPALQYFRGLKQVKHDTEAHPTYLLGQSKPSGSWWYYFPVAIVTKTPLPELLAILGILLILAVPAWRARLGLPGHEILLLLLPAAIFLLSAVNAGMNLGLRHILPVYPFLLILVGGWVMLPWRGKALPVVAVLLLGLQSLALYRAQPDYLSYFNVLVGGPDRGYKVLVDSNYDWGQDLGELAKVQDRLKLNPLQLCYFGTTPPEAYGIKYTPVKALGVFNDAPQADLTQPGYFAISVTNLQAGKVYGDMDYSFLKDVKPIARAGRTIFIYQLPIAPR